MYEFIFQDLGEGLTEGEVIQWLVKKGEDVKKDQPVIEVETDKAVAEIASPVAGKMQKLHFKAGEIVKVGQPLFTIDDGSGAAAPKADDSEMSVVGKVAGTSEVLQLRRDRPTSASAKPAASATAVKATLAVRKLANELGVDLSMVKGSGAEGRIVEDDVRKAGGASKSGAAADGPVERIPLRGTRRKIAEHMMQAQQQTAAVTHGDKADLTALWDQRAKDAKKQKDVKLTFLPYIIKAAVGALKAHPTLNASLEGEEIVLKKYYNIGIAVDTDSGLRVPVVKDADKKSVVEIAKEITTLAQQARDRSIDLADMQGGTFSITNIGSLGGTFFTPIINFPESGILGVGQIREEPIVVDGNIEIRRMGYFALTFDHRILDGVEGAKFMNTFLGLLQEPGKL